MIWIFHQRTVNGGGVHIKIDYYPDHFFNRIRTIDWDFQKSWGVEKEDLKNKKKNEKIKN